MPADWNEAIDTHRSAVVRDVLIAVDALIAEGGVLNLSMSAIASRANIGRATLYRYFSSVDQVFAAWQQQRITDHLDELRRAAVDTGQPVLIRLAGTLMTYVQLARHGTHGDHHPAHPDLLGLHRHVASILSPLLAEAARLGHVRTDVPSSELASFCAAALGPIAQVRNRAQARRLVVLTTSAIGVPTLIREGDGEVP
jgi:AcrR family transcriptional regulator